MTLESRFHVPEGPYLLSHSVGCLPRSASQSLAQNFLQPWEQSGGDAWPKWLDGIGEFKQQLALLFNTQAEAICPQTNLSSGFTKFLMSLPRGSSQRTKIVMHRDAFPSMGYVAQALARMSLTLELVESLEPDDWQAHLQDDVLCVLLTHVHSNTGKVSAINQLARLCRQQQIYCAVDIAQSAGILPIDISTWPVDAVFGSCVKWLCGGPGAGFMWVDPELVGQLQPMDVGWFSHQNPFEMDIQKFTLAKGADRFWGGTPSVAPYVIAANSVAEIRKIGVDTLLQHNRQCAQQLLAVLQQPIDLAQQGGTLCVQLTSSQLSQFNQQMQRLGAHYDQRGNTVRLSPHIYTSAQDIAAVSQILAEL